MKGKGCKPKGIALVERLDGSSQAKERLEVILATIAGQLKINEACARLKIKPARLHQMRTTVLQASLARLEPRPAGRRPHQPTAEESHSQDLERQLRELSSALKIAEMREELARVLPPRHAGEPTRKKPAAIPKGNR
jgi:hypothetical protein